MHMRQLIVISWFFLTILIKYQIQSIILRPFYWNQTTFRSTEHGSLVFEVRLGDVMDLICPFYDEEQSYLTSKLEQYDIYRVTSNEYERCNTDQLNIDPLTRLVITCNSPHDLMKYTLNFRSYLPIPNGFEFRSNQTYYFLSTSSNFNQQPCQRLKILVYDYSRSALWTSTRSSVNENEPQALLPGRHHQQQQHGSISSSSIDKAMNSNEQHRPFLHSIKAQRFSDPYSIQWITETPQQLKDTDKSSGTPNALSASNSSSHTISLALSSSSRRQSISLIFIFLIVCLS